MVKSKASKEIKAIGSKNTIPPTIGPAKKKRSSKRKSAKKTAPATVGTCQAATKDTTMQVSSSQEEDINRQLRRLKHYKSIFQTLGEMHPNCSEDKIIIQAQFACEMLSEKGFCERLVQLERNKENDEPRDLQSVANPIEAMQSLETRLDANDRRKHLYRLLDRVGKTMGSFPKLASYNFEQWDARFKKCLSCIPLALEHLEGEIPEQDPRYDAELDEELRTLIISNSDPHSVKSLIYFVDHKNSSKGADLYKDVREACLESLEIRTTPIHVRLSELRLEKFNVLKLANEIESIAADGDISAAEMSTWLNEHTKHVSLFANLFEYLKGISGFHHFVDVVQQYATVQQEIETRDRYTLLCKELYG